MPKFESLLGKRFGRLIVLSQTRKTKYLAWLCRCDCGTEKVVLTGSLKSGNTVSCGCFLSEAMKARQTKHGHTAAGIRSYLYTTWAGLLKRCRDANHPTFKRYGARGIRFHEAWTDFPTFARDILSEIGERPSRQHSLDRVDNNGHYEPGNLRWATMKEQSRNREGNRYMTVNGVRKTVIEWCETSGINSNVMLARLRRGWSDEKAVTTPVEPRKPRRLKP